MYLAVYGWDLIEEAYYSGRSVPKQDRPLWIVNCNLHVRARLGAGREPIVNDPEIPVHNYSGTDGFVRNIAVMELAAARFGKTAFTVGDSIQFSATLLTHGRAYRMDWQGTFRLSE